jgi:gamma-glutamyl hercynylcysteine S-oxide synthase
MTIATVLTGWFGRTPQTTPVPQNLAQTLLKNAEIAPDVRRLIRQRQYCKMLSKVVDLTFDDISVLIAWESMQQEMALVPPGSIQLAAMSPAASTQRIEVAACYVDRFCVTNADFAQFVESGGYEDTKLWPESILTDLLKFTDSSGAPGPKFWVGGKPPKDLLDHPVVGVCWLEANAYAQWVGKRLPSPAQWQRTACWGKSSGGNESRYPWGNSYNQEYANTWASRFGGTVPVNQFSAGATPSGVYQLIGNTWEWLNGEFVLNHHQAESNQHANIMAEIRGGAFDTYFASQATCQFRTGQPLLVRAANIGFRCCVECSQLVDEPNSQID